MEVKEDKTLPKGPTKCFTLSLIFLFLNVAPVTGFSLRFCRISYDIALCDKSYLKAVPQDIPSSVKGVNLASNKISKLKVSDFKKLLFLTQLDLKHNEISQIVQSTFVNLIALKKLNLNNNRLVKLEDNIFEGLSNLTELRISSNHIQVVASSSFRALTSLTLLDISNNKLNHVSNIHYVLQHLPNLREFKIRNNNLKTFYSWELGNSSLQISSLDLSENPMKIFQITADIFTNLKWLTIAGAPKNMIWDVPNNAFLRQVSTFDISERYLYIKDIKILLDSINSSLTSLRVNSVKLNHTVLINMSCSIPTVTTLQLRHNKFFFISSNLFQLCFNVTEIYLSQNKIQHIDEKAFRYLPHLRILSLGSNMLSSVPAATKNLPTLSELDLSNNNISTLGCQDFTNLTKLKQLHLYLNKISALSDCVFKDLIGLHVLKLENNQISELNGAFRNYLPNLKQLHLNTNKLTTLKNGEFKGLKSLQNLSLHNNEIKVIENWTFIGLTNLTEIQLQSNDIYKTVINNGAFNYLINLKRLDLRDNHIHYENSKALPNPPFSNLSKLEILAVPGQHRRGKSQLPCNFLQGLTNLLVFYARNMQLISLPIDMFKYTPKLQILDISSNDMVDISPDLFWPIRGLKSLYISRTNLRSLDFLIEANLTELEFLQSRKNAFSVIGEKEIRSLPALIYLDIKYNSFTCDCDNAWFLQWAENDKQTQLFDAYNFECNYPPDLKGTKLLELDIRSCSVETDFICFISTTCMILLFMVASFTYHFLRLQLVYAYHLFLAFLFDTKQRNKQAPKQYDAFISYNTYDEPWVIREMLPKLEGEQGWRLCLHHRDFEPGRPIIDNITDAIYGSRKTICVISHRYLNSEWCSREIQVASFRLFDEHKDVLILVFLEDIPTSLLSPYYRMRKLLQRRTYLSWQQAGENTELFWEKLRQALNTSEDPGDDRFLLTVEDRP